MFRRLALRPLAPLLVAVALAGCSDDHGTLGGPATGDVVEIEALDNRFEPLATTVAVGSTVRFVNGGRSDHDVVPADGDGWGVAASEFGPGADYEVVFDEPGTYRYVCTLHGTVVNGRGIGMAGAVEVIAG